MMNLKFVKDYWSFRAGQIVPVAEITQGRAHIIVSRGFAEYVDDAPAPPKDRPKPKRKRKPPEPTPLERAVLEPEETRDVRSTGEDTASE